MGFPRQEYWSESPSPSPGDLPNPEIESTSPALVGGFFTTDIQADASVLSSCIDRWSLEKKPGGFN